MLTNENGINKKAFFDLMAKRNKDRFDEFVVSMSESERQRYQEEVGRLKLFDPEGFTGNTSQ